MATAQTSKSNNDRNKKNQSRSSARNTESQTGERDENYNLVSVLYHALQGADTLTQYRRDAQQDEELAQFFQEAQASYVQVAQQAKQLLAERIEVEDSDEEEDEEDDSDE